MTADEKFYTLLEILGAHQFVEEINRALSTDDAHDIYNYIACTYDIEFDED